MKARQYISQPIDTADVKLPRELKPLVELMVKNVHEVWVGLVLWRAAQRCAKDPSLFCSLRKLPDEEKEYDRLMALDTIKLVKKLGFEIIKRK